MLRALSRAAALVDARGWIVDRNDLFNNLFDSNVQRAGQSGMPAVWDALPVERDAVNGVLSGGVAAQLLIQDELEHSRAVAFFPLDSQAMAQWLVTVQSPDFDPSIPIPGSNVDPLTNLPDAAFIRKRLEGILNPSHGEAAEASVFCVDLDRFDQINTDHGRVAGDLVLVEAARRLGRSIRATNILGRQSEDMFIVIVPDRLSTERITAVASRLIASIASPFEIKGQREPIILTASVGVATTPMDGMDAKELIEHAQAAVDLAKRTGTGTFQFFDNATESGRRERRSRVNQLRRGISQGHLHLTYQPKVSLRSGEVTGAEALVRWHDPVTGTIMPNDFIQLAEDAGLIHELGRSVLREAMEAIAFWRERGLRHIRLAINVSAREIARREFLAQLRDHLIEYEVNPDCLELEITESAVMERAEEVITSLRAIRDLGVHLTADDFGTGYASLSYLRNFPLDGIKIDTTFVADIEQNVKNGGGLAAAVIAVGRNLGMEVVAEGVETHRQMEYLRAQDCDAVQGYLLSGPLSRDEFMDFASRGAVLPAD